MGIAREEIINIYDTLPARYNLGFRGIKEEPEPIAQGMFGPLHRGRWGDRGVAVKKFDMENTEGNFNLASKEMSRMIRLRHPNVLNVYGFYFVGEGHVLKCSMVMELMDFDLAKYIEQRQGEGLALTDDEVVYIITEIARGMKHVHENGYLHRDLKPQNVLMRRLAVLTSFHLDVKVADFGSSELMSGGHCDRTVGTSCYKAPEQFDRDAPLRPDKLDVYSFGCLCFKLWTGRDPPFKNHAELMKLWEQRCSRTLPGDVEVIISKCLDIDPDTRPEFSKISGDLDAVLKERQPEQLPHCEEVTHKEAADPVVCGKMWKRLLFLICYSAPLQKCQRKYRKQQVSYQWIVKELGLDGGVNGLDYADYVIPPKELVVCSNMTGWGMTATIYEVSWKGIRCALKVYRSDHHFVRDILNAEPPRFKMFPTLIHDNIVRFFGYSLTRLGRGNGMCPSILMELLASDLKTYLIRTASRSHDFADFINRRSWKLMKGIAEGIKFLHGKDWVHGDLKPSNVLVNDLDRIVDADDIVVKLTDFSLVSPDIAGFTIRYAAPELLQTRHDKDLRRRIDYKKADVYSFAITCSDILGHDEGFGFRDSPHEFCEQVIAGTRPMLPLKTMWGLQNLIKRCWSRDPTERPSFCDICKFFSRPMPMSTSVACHDNMPPAQRLQSGAPNQCKLM